MLKYDYRCGNHDGKYCGLRKQYQDVFYCDCVIDLFSSFKKEMCVNQISRPDAPMLPGYGDCRACVSDQKNKECKGYIPVTVKVFDVL